jgi:predicted phage tail protein
MKDRRLVDVHLHGPLADKYGALHRFDIATPQEAIRALDANYPGFVRDFAATKIYYLIADGDCRAGDDAGVLPFSREMHLVPQIEGRAFLAVALVGALFPALTTATIFGISAATLIGSALFLGVMVGLSFLFRPKVPEAPDEERNENFAFTGPENVTGQGVAVPLAYGRVHCGSVVVSAGLEVAQLASWAHTEKYRNELRSHQYARVIDAISDGQIQGIRSHNDIFLDGVPLPNFDNTEVQIRNGTRSQSIMSGFASQQTEIPVGVEMKYAEYIVRTIDNLEADRVRITLMTPSLQEVEDDGDMNGRKVSYGFDIQQIGTGGYVNKLQHSMEGKTQSQYQRSYILALPKPGPWNIRVMRVTQNSTSSRVQDDLYWESYTEIVDDRVNYNATAAVGLFLDSEQFQTIPRRTFLVDGIICRVPTNYDPVNATYDGVWDGTFKLAWTNNPAWIFLDLLIHRRHGIGEFLTLAQVDKWSLYQVSQWCDGRVPNGRGGHERRFTCNIQITDRQEAFDLIAQIASIFRGFTYWNGSQMVAVADQPSDPVHQFTNANVIEGNFTYSGSDLRARHTMATVRWNDPAQLGQPRVAVVEDPEAMARYGIQEAEIDAVGCTSEAQAIRTGKWALYTELYEGEAVTFSTGLESAFVRPGEIIRVMDVNIAGKRRGGRVGAGSTAERVYFDDANVGEFTAAGDVYLSCIIDEGSVQTRQVAAFGADAGRLYADLVDPFGGVVVLDGSWVLSEPGDLEPTLWRVITVRQVEADVYEINAVRHFPDKWAYVERNVPLSDPDISDIVVAWPAVTGLAVQEYLVQLSPISVGVRVVLSWISDAPQFQVEYRKENGNWTLTRTDQKAIDLPSSEGAWEFRVTPISTLGVRGKMATLNYTVQGRFLPPAAPQQLRIKISDGVALFEWLPSVELDVIIGGHFELRHASQTSGATWNTAQVVIPSIPGSATTVEAVYRPGTWFLKTFDIVGIASTDAAVVIALQPDGRYNEFARVCEHPDWLGTHNYTEVLEPQDWLVLGQTGGMWDEQTTDMDDWPDVDVLVEGAPPSLEHAPRHGWYVFENRIDAGGVFTVRFSAEILAFPFADPDEFIDSRLDNCDDWADWDNITEDLGGQVQLYIRTTNDDPASPTATWSNWQAYAPVDYTARGFEFRADLFAPAGQNIGIEKLCITADLRMKMDSNEDVPYPAAQTHVTFTVKFYLVPSVVVTVQNAMATDDIQVINKTRQGFDVTIKQGATHQTRTFDWQARGF